MEDFFNKLSMRTYSTGKCGDIPTKNINEAIRIYVPDEETAERLSNWATSNDFPGLVNCVPGWYRWDDESEEFYCENVEVE